MRTFIQTSTCLLVLLVLAGLSSGTAAGQQKIGYVDSEYILNELPEYATIQTEIDRLAQDYQQELETLQRDLEADMQAYEARELLYTEQERQERRDQIRRQRENLIRLQDQYFGPEGDLFREQDRRLQPLQERVLVAIEAVAAADGYDYVFDKQGDLLFLFAREQYDLSDRVLEELGIDLEDRTSGRNR